MTEVHVTQFDKDGRLHNEFYSPELVHYPQDDMTFSQKPFFIFYALTEPPWHISAKNGKSLNGDQRMLLWDNVQIQQMPGLHSHHMTIDTSLITLYPHLSFAQTERPVTITQPNTVIHAIGMQADLKTSAVKLMSETKGQHVQQK
jgi:LPS export ABC transporter protein LptC